MHAPEWFMSLNSDMKFQVVALAVVAFILISSVIYVGFTSVAETLAIRKMIKLQAHEHGLLPRRHRIVLILLSPFFAFLSWYFKLLGI